MDEITQEPGALVERVAALDIGKAALTACVRVPHEDKPGARRQEVRTYATVTPALLDLRDWLTCQGVTLVVMEATSAYWKPPFYLLEDAIACQVVNARDVKNVPGRPKTDKLDAVWLCKLAERGMLRPSFIPPRPQRQLRDLTRYRRTLTQERTREKQRAEKLLEDAPLTELRGQIAVSGSRAGLGVATVPARDHRRGWGTGSAVTGGIPARCA
jgi:transposase